VSRTRGGGGAYHSKATDLSRPLAAGEPVLRAVKRFVSQIIDVEGFDASSEVERK
jgi:hypothetical protein